MRIKSIIIVFVTLFLANIDSQAQTRNLNVYKNPEMNKTKSRGNIKIPNIGQYTALKCDFHVHTIFSDGLVWPTVRVDEAFNEGLDVIAITDHIEYRPKKDIIIGDLNTPADIAVKYAEKTGIIVIKGTEITRKKPFGHMNALFINDAEKLNVKEPVEAIEEALKQDAFIMWNHPGWPNDTTTMYPVHEKLITEKKIHGIEVFNHFEYYPVSFDWCRDYNLTFMGNSDIHHTIANTYGNGKNMRPITIVFASERTEKGVKDALFAGRTAVCFNNNLVGRTDILEQLVRASLAVDKVDPKKNVYTFTNSSDLIYILELNFGRRKDTVVIPAGSRVRATLPEGNKATVANCFTGSNQFLEITF